MVSAQTGTATMVGPEGGWSAAISATVLNNKLYTVETDGAIYETDLTTTAKTAIGKAEYGNSRFIFATTTNLFIIDYNGTMFKVDPVKGGKEKVFLDAAWSDTYTFIAYKDNFYSINKKGVLTNTDLKTNTTRQMGTTYSNIINMYATNDKLYLTEESGKMYEMNPLNGSQKLLSTNGVWSGIIAGTGYKDGLYMIDKTGILYSASLASGGKTKMGKPEFRLAKFLIGGNGNLYFIETTGSLYEIQL